MSFWSSLKNWLSGNYSEWAQNVDRHYYDDTGMHLEGVSDPLHAADNTFSRAVTGASRDGTLGTIVNGFWKGLGAILDPIGEANRLFNKEENELSYQRQLELMKFQNDYNTPEAQMQRLREAGLNPNLMYGQGSTGNTAVSTPQYEPTKSDLSAQSLQQAAGGIALYHNIELQKAQIDNLAKTQELTAARTAKTLAEAAMAENKAAWYDQQLGYQTDAMYQDLRTKEIKNNLLSPKQKYAKEEAALEYMSKLYGIPVAKLKADLAKDGLTDRDATWVRIVYQLLTDRGSSTGGASAGLLQKFTNKFRKWLDNAAHPMTPEDKEIWRQIKEVEDEEMFNRLHDSYGN